MGDLWTPPPGFFPGANSWLHPGNIDRFQPVFRRDENCSYISVGTYVYGFTPACDGSAIGKPIHVWDAEPPAIEDFGVITACVNGDYEVSGFTIGSTSNLYCTIGTGAAATIQDIARGIYTSWTDIPASAIRYGWLFCALNIVWFRRGDGVIHWLGPPP